MSDIDPTQPMLIVYGDIVDGFRFVGPVMPNDPHVDHFIDTKLANEVWWYAPVTPGPKAPDTYEFAVRILDTQGTQVEAKHALQEAAAALVDQLDAAQVIVEDI